VAEVVASQKRVVTGLRPTAPSPRLVDCDTIAEQALASALELCAKRMSLDNSKAAARVLCQGDSVVRMNCCAGIAKQMTESLALSYAGINAVYAPSCNGCPEGFCLADGVQNAPMVHLLVWAQHKTAAMDLRVAALDAALARAYRNTVGTNETPSLLRVGVLDDADLEHLFGNGHVSEWPFRLQAYLLAMNEPVDPLFIR